MVKCVQEWSSEGTKETGKQMREREEGGGVDEREGVGERKWDTLQAAASEKIAEDPSRRAPALYEAGGGTEGLWVPGYHRPFIRGIIAATRT